MLPAAPINAQLRTDSWMPHISRTSNVNIAPAPALSALIAEYQLLWRQALR